MIGSADGNRKGGCWAVGSQILGESYATSKTCKTNPAVLFNHQGARRRVALGSIWRAFHMEGLVCKRRILLLSSAAVFFARGARGGNAERAGERWA